MTNRKVILILGVTILVLSFMGLILYQMHEQKQAALEQLRVLKGKEEARAKQEEEKRRAEQERQKAEEKRREAELAEKQRIEQKRKFEDEEAERFKQEMDTRAREERRRVEEDQAKIREKERQENRIKAAGLKPQMEIIQGNISSLESKIKEHRQFREYEDKKLAYERKQGLYRENVIKYQEINKTRFLMMIESEEKRLQNYKEKVSEIKQKYDELMK